MAYAVHYTALPKWFKRLITWVATLSMQQGRDATDDDVEAVYAQFEPALFSILDRFAEPKPFVLQAVEELRRMGVKIGSTTGYTDSMMQVVAPKAASLGYEPDCWFSPDSTGGIGRPYPFMIFQNMEALGVSDVRHVVKVGDTVSDIREGVNSGAWSVGVVEGSSELGLSREEFETLGYAEREKLCREAEATFRAAGAHFVIGNMSELPQLIRNLGVN